MAKTARARPTRTSWVASGLVGALFTAVAAFLAVTGLKSGPVALGLAGILGAVGLFLLLVAAGKLRTFYLGSKATSLFPATILEVRRDLVEERNSRQIFWKIIARGAWPDGASGDFESVPLKADPGSAFLPGQSILIRGEPRSRVYTMDLATVSGEGRQAAEMRPRGLPGPTQQRPLEPSKGLAAGGAMAAVGVAVYVFSPAALPFAAMFGGFGLFICGLVYLGQRTKLQIADGGAVFKVKVDKITHTVVHSGTKSYDRWSVEAIGVWPDGLTQTFYAQAATSLGSLKEGDLVRVRGNKKTRAYEVDLAAKA